MLNTKYLYTRLKSANDKVVELLVTLGELTTMSNKGIAVKCNSVQESNDKEHPENTCFFVTVNRQEALNKLSA